jgi:hypothetical protein
LKNFNPLVLCATPFAIHSAVNTNSRTELPIYGREQSLILQLCGGISFWETNEAGALKEEIMFTLEDK